MPVGRSVEVDILLITLSGSAQFRLSGLPTFHQKVRRPEIVQACHEELRTHFEPLIRATQALPEVHVFTSLTLRLVRLAKATEVLCQAGLNEESQLPFRSASESIVNLLYIMHVGPKTGDKSSTDLAKQFLAYGDVAYLKMLQRRPEQARSALKKHRGFSDTEFDTFLEEKRKSAEEAAISHNCSGSRWHKLNLIDMAAKVRDNAPAFVVREIADIAFSSFVGANSAIHADALSLRRQYSALGNAPLELVFTPEHTYADVVGQEAFWAWKVVAEYYNHSEVVDQCFEHHMRIAITKRYEAASPCV